ncbi:MAG: hypothetical protein Q9160_006375 [Pyrenula sp. 1 TL-2023]
MKPTQSLARNGARLRMTTKSINGGYYKGNRSGSMGAHTNFGGYVVDWRKVRTYNCPELSGFELTPFVTKQMEMTRPVTVSDPFPATLKRPIDFVSEEAYQDYINYETRTKIDGLELIRSFSQDEPERYDQLLEQTEKTEVFQRGQAPLGDNVEAAFTGTSKQTMPEQPTT